MQVLESIRLRDNGFGYYFFYKNRLRAENLCKKNFVHSYVFTSVILLLIERGSGALSVSGPIFTSPESKILNLQ